MPDAILDLDEIGRAAGSLGESIDLDAIGQAAPVDDIIARERKKESLRAQVNFETNLPDPDKTLDGGIMPQAWLGIKSGFSQAGQYGNKLLELAARSGGINPIQSELLAPGSGRQTVEQFRGASEIAGQKVREIEQLGQKTQGPDLVRHVAGGLVSMLPAMAAAPLGLPAAVTAVGLQSFGSVFANAEEAYIARGDSPTVARRKALWPALATGVGTALITRGFGATGIENWTKALAGGTFRQTLKEIAKAAGFEASEEWYDQIQQRLWEELSYRPSADFTQALQMTLEESSMAGLSGLIAAGGLRTVTAVSGRRAAEPGAVPPAAHMVSGTTPARRSAAAFAEAQGIPVSAESIVGGKKFAETTPVGAEPVKPVVAVPPVEEIEPFGPLRQFRVTREFVNPADEGVYRVGSIITEPQLTKAGVAVPEPKATVAEIQPLEQKAEVPSAISQPIAAPPVVGETPQGGAQVGQGISPSGEVTGTRPVVAPEVKVEAADAAAGALNLDEPASFNPWWKQVSDAIAANDEVAAARLIAKLPPIDPKAPPKYGGTLLALTSPSRIGSTLIDRMATADGTPLFTWRNQLDIARTAAAPEVVPPVAPAKPPGERVTLRNNKTVELPEFTLEAIRRGSEDAHTGRTLPASVMFNPRDKGFLLIKGPAKMGRATYRIPLSDIPHEIVKGVNGSITFDKQAVLDFLNDKARRQAVMVDDRNVVHYAPEDIDVIQKPLGRPATGAGAPLGQVTMDPKVLEALAAEAQRRPPPEPEAIAALDALEKANPRMAEALERRRTEELGSVFWAGVREEFLNMADRPEYREPLMGNGLELYRRQTDPSEQIANPTKADSLIASIRLLKERGDISGAKYSLAPKGWEGITGEPARAAQEAANLREARTLVDDPNNGLSAEARAVLRTILDSPVAAALNGRQIRFRIVDASDETRGVSGWYEPATQMINIVRRTAPSTGAHEFFHPLWEIVQDADRRNVRTWRDAAIDAARRTATGKDLADLEKLSDEFDTVFGADVGYRGYRDMRYETFLSEGIADKFYHLSSAEEFFAWMLTDRFGKDRIGIWRQAREIFTSQDAFLSRVRQILQVIFDAIRQRIPGLRTQADVLQRTILSGKYDVLPPSENIPAKIHITHENGQEVPLRQAMGEERGVQAALESRKNVEKYVEPLEQMRSPEFYGAMASVINRGLVPEPRAERYFALPMPVALELRDVFPYRIETQRPTGATLREVMADEVRTPEERNEYARNALAELQLYQHNRQEVKRDYDKVAENLDEATVQAIRAIPPTNEANVEAVNRLGQIIDRIQTERVKTAEGAQVNAVIGEGIEHIDALNQLLRDAPAHSRALTGIARLVGRSALTAARGEGEVLDLISVRSNFLGSPATEREWVQQLATHLDQMRTPEDNRVINAGRDVIEGTLWGLRQLEDFRQHLLEVQMADDGTLRRFNEDYLNDLRSKTPRGFNAILNKYAKVKVESDALNSAARRLNRKIDALTTRRENLRQAVEFLNEHDADLAFQEFGKAAAEFTGGTSAVEYTDLGPVRTYKDPMTGKPVDVEHTFDKGETFENLAKIKGLIESGLEYAAQPNADPVKAKFWIDWANDWEDYLMGINSDARLQDPHWIFNPTRVLTKSKYGLIVETTLSRLPGALAEQGSRASEAFAGAKKAKDEWLKAQSDLLLGINLAARSKHPGMSLDRWQKEVASPIIDSRQHFGQEEYRTGQRIAGFGHLITPEDMKAVRSQYAFEQHFRKLHEKVKFPAITEAPVKIKEGDIQRFALSRGPGTVTHSIPKSTRDLPAQWAEALKVPPEQGGVDMFLSNKDNFIRIALGHVMEAERPYFLLGKGRFALDYRAMRAEKQSLQASGQMPANLDGLSEWIARKHNESLAQGEAPATPGEVRKTLVDEITSFMKEIEKNTAERKAVANAANMEIIVNENGFTQPRRGKIAPGTLYEYGLPDKGAMQTKGNEAIEFYAFRYRDAMQAIHDALLKDKEKLEKELGDIYGSTGIIAKHKLDRAIRAGNDPFLQKKQLTLEEVNRNLTRTGHFLNNINDIVKNRRGTYVDDVTNHALNPWGGFAVGSALMRPLTWMRNAASGPVLWGLKTAEIRRGGWMRMPDRVLTQHIVSFINTMRIAMVPKTAQERAVKQYLAGHPEEALLTAKVTAALLREIVDRHGMREIGVLDSFSIRDNIGWDSERPLWQNIKIALDTMRNVSAHTESSDANSIFSTLGIIPRAGQLLTRKIGMRWTDNWINSKGTQFTNGLSNELRKRAIISFDGRLRSDPVFRELYEQYGDNYQRFSTALIGRVSGVEQGGLLTPAELTGKWGLGGMDKSAIQLRRTFRRNNDAVDLIMLKYWWNKRHANGDRNAPFFTDGERMALIFALAEDVNMGTMATRAQWWAGSKEKQWAGVLGQYWLWATDRMADMMAKPHGQRTAMVRYMPGVIAFLLASGIAAVVSTALGQKVNNALFNTVSQKPSFFDATDDKTRALAAISTAASLWGAFGSLIAYVTDTPGKLGYKNPFFFANVANDLMGVVSKWYQTGDATGPVLDILARYQPAAQAIINRLPSREGLVEVRNAANALRAATPGTLEAKRRQPSSGNDLRATPMTPLYNTILNAAATGQWDVADEAWAKAVEQSRASGNPNPEQAILSAIRTRAPESAVFSRVLTDGERDMVYGRLTPEGRARVDRVNSAFDAIASRYGTGGATARSFGGGSRFGALPRGSSGALADIGGFGGSRRLSLGSPRGVRSGFRSRSLRRGLRTRRLRGGLRRPRRSRLRRLAV